MASLPKEVRELAGWLETAIDDAVEFAAGRTSREALDNRIEFKIGEGCVQGISLSKETIVVVKEA